MNTRSLQEPNCTKTFLLMTVSFYKIIILNMAKVRKCSLQHHINYFYLLHISSSCGIKTMSKKYLPKIINHQSLWIINFKEINASRTLYYYDKVTVIPMYLEVQKRLHFNDHRKNSLWKSCCTCEHHLLWFRGRKWLKSANLELLAFQNKFLLVCVCTCACVCV